MSTEPNSFSKYLVIFVDILGSQNRTDFQEMYQINKIFYDEFEKNQRTTDHIQHTKGRYSHFPIVHIFFTTSKTAFQMNVKI